MCLFCDQREGVINDKSDVRWCAQGLQILEIKFLAKQRFTGVMYFSMCGGVRPQFFVIPRVSTIRLHVYRALNFTLAYQTLDAKVLHHQKIRNKYHQPILVYKTRRSREFFCSFKMKVSKLQKLQVKVLKSTALFLYDGPDALCGRLHPAVGRPLVASTFQALAQVVGVIFAIQQSFDYKGLSNIKNFQKIHLKNGSADVNRSCSGNHCIFATHSAANINITLTFLKYFGFSDNTCTFGGTAIFAQEQNENKEIITLCENITNQPQSIVLPGKLVTIVQYSYKPLSQIFEHIKLETTLCEGVVINPILGNMCVQILSFYRGQWFRVHNTERSVKCETWVTKLSSSLKLLPNDKKDPQFTKIQYTLKQHKCISIQLDLKYKFSDVQKLEMNGNKPVTRFIPKFQLVPAPEHTLQHAYFIVASSSYKNYFSTCSSDHSSSTCVLPPRRHVENYGRKRGLQGGKISTTLCRATLTASYTHLLRDSNTSHWNCQQHETNESKYFTLPTHIITTHDHAMLVNENLMSMDLQCKLQSDDCSICEILPNNINCKSTTFNPLCTHKYTSSAFGCNLTQSKHHPGCNFIPGGSVKNIEVLWNQKLVLHMAGENCSMEDVYEVKLQTKLTECETFEEMVSETKCDQAEGGNHDHDTCFQQRVCSCKPDIFYSLWSVNISSRQLQKKPLDIDIPGHVNQIAIKRLTTEHSSEACSLVGIVKDATGAQVYKFNSTKTRSHRMSSFHLVASSSDIGTEASKTRSNLNVFVKSSTLSWKAARILCQKTNSFLPAFDDTSSLQQVVNLFKTLFWMPPPEAIFLGVQRKVIVPFISSSPEPDMVQKNILIWCSKIPPLNVPFHPCKNFFVLSVSFRLGVFSCQQENL